MTSARSLILVMLGFVLAACSAAQRFNETAALPLARWEAHDPESTLRVDHAVWDGFLLRYAGTAEDSIVRVAYGRVSEADRGALAGYLATLGHVPVSRLPRPEQFAFWVNLHNALAIKLVLDHYPVASIRDINLSRGMTEWGPFAAKLASVEGEVLSLDDILHRILRPIWHEPRVHYVINPAAVGAPNLPLQALTAANAQELMTRGGREFVNQPRGATVRGGVVQVSSLYTWYQADFGGGEKGVIAHLRRFAAPELGVELAESRGLGGNAFDWTLNVAE